MTRCRSNHGDAHQPQRLIPGACIIKMMTIGIDIGGSSLKGLLVDGHDKRDTFLAKTPTGLADFIVTLQARVTPWLAGRNRLMGIGLGVAGVLDQTTVADSPNLPFLRSYNLAELFDRSIPIRIDNDARAYLRGECILAPACAQTTVLLIALGTGVGRAYARHGQVELIHDLEYPEPWEREYQALRDGPDEAVFVQFLVTRLEPMIHDFKPEVLIVTGGVATRPGLLAKLRTAFARQGVGVTIKPSAGGDFVAALGAAALFGR